MSFLVCLLFLNFNFLFIFVCLQILPTIPLALLPYGQPIAYTVRSLAKHIILT